MTFTVATARQSISHGFNVLVQGRHGVGKTSVVLEACRLEKVALVILNAATLDVYTQLVGVPDIVKAEATGEKTIAMVRPSLVNDAEVLFVDELNRAMDPRTTNAVFEMIQFRTINGEPLKKLRAVFAAQNPPEDGQFSYQVQALDPALVDRFHLTLTMEAKLSLPYLTTKFPPAVAEALVEWYDARDSSRADYISPRRMELIGQVFMATKNEALVRAAFPPEGSYEVGKLCRLLKDALKTPEERARAAAQAGAAQERLTGLRPGAQRPGRAATPVGPATPRPSTSATRTQASPGLPIYEALKARDKTSLRKQALVAASAWAALSLSDKLTLAEALNSAVGVRDLAGKWLATLNLMGTPELQRLTQGWSYAKRRSLIRELRQAEKKGKTLSSPLLTHVTVLASSTTP